MPVPKEHKKLHITTHANTRIQQRGFNTAEVREMFKRARLLDDTKNMGFDQIRFLYKKYLFVVEETKHQYRLVTVYKVSRQKRNELSSYI